MLEASRSAATPSSPPPAAPRKPTRTDLLSDPLPRGNVLLPSSTRDAMPWFKRKPRITDENYGKLMTSFGRVVDRDPLVREPAQALADRILDESPALIVQVDTAVYAGATHYHLRLLAGAWILSHEGAVPRATAEVFEEAVAWRFAHISKDASRLAHRLSSLARGETERDLSL